MIRAYDDNGNPVDLVDWEKQIRADAIDELIEIIGALESCCIDHEENEIGEWLTFTFNYEKWADMLRKLEQLKEQNRKE